MSSISQTGRDEDILDLYFARDERAIAETQERYGRVCLTVAMGILDSRSDAEECVNDTYLRAWNTIPPERPRSLCAYVCRIVRNLSISRLREVRAARRSRELTVSLEELSDCLPAVEASGGELSRYLSDFLRGEDAESRRLFLGRYWYGQSVKDLAADYGIPARAVSQKLFRTRERLRVYLTERGYSL